jgi:hypothetical protein
MEIIVLQPSQKEFKKEFLLRGNFIGFGLVPLITN